MLRTLRGVTSQIGVARDLAADRRSFARLAGDFVLYRVLRIARLPSLDQERRIRLKNGVDLTYRLNRGDIWTIYEVFHRQDYLAPGGLTPKVTIDLGANIGMTSVWLAKKYNCERMLAVEPMSANAELARRNFQNNSLPIQLIEAAVSAADGEAVFQQTLKATEGFLVTEDDDAKRKQENAGVAGRRITVPVLSMESLLKHLPDKTTVDFLKLDIEGGEKDLLGSNLDWLQRIRSISAEFHPNLVDVAQLIRTVEQAGFRYIAPGSPDAVSNMECFVKKRMRDRTLPNTTTIHCRRGLHYGKAAFRAQ